MNMCCKVKESHCLFYTWNIRFNIQIKVYTNMSTIRSAIQSCSGYVVILSISFTTVVQFTVVLEEYIPQAWPSHETVGMNAGQVSDSNQAIHFNPSSSLLWGWTSSTPCDNLKVALRSLKCAFFSPFMLPYKCHYKGLCAKKWQHIRSERVKWRVDVFVTARTLRRCNWTLNTAP
jgi:hypothetical protein